MESVQEFMKCVFDAMEDNGGECIVINDNGKIRVLSIAQEPKILARYSSKSVAYRDLQEWVLEDAIYFGLKK